MLCTVLHNNYLGTPGWCAGVNDSSQQRTIYLTLYEVLIIQTMWFCCYGFVFRYNISKQWYVVDGSSGQGTMWSIRDDVMLRLSHMSLNSTVITDHFTSWAVASLMILITTKITICCCITAAKGGGWDWVWSTDVESSESTTAALHAMAAACATPPDYFTCLTKIKHLS